ncbi:unnamed protein product [Clonostachys rosea]|uniref:AAA+ ATPase domain-containing protein n=1 Tax=Bionectria ochroleuca TaxID=29856 RepID=A0ABY6U6D1_BIOOC|nr:unnamed protein product [Clonostachys rosea]
MCCQDETLPSEEAKQVVDVADAVPGESPSVNPNNQQYAVQSKEDKARRSALLKEKREQMKQKHDQEIAELEEEISYQKELLRWRREQKSQKRDREKLRERLASLQRMLENDDDFETEDEDNLSEAAKTNEESGSQDIETPPTSESPVPEDQKAASVKDEHDDIDNEPIVWPLNPSPSKQEWEEQKIRQGQENESLDSLMDMVGLEKVKAQFMIIKNLVDTAHRQDADLTKEAFGAVFMGRPGTGKTTVAGLYAQFLSSMGIVPGSLQLKETTESHLRDGGVEKCKSIIEGLETSEWDEEAYENRTVIQGVIFIDEAHNLAPKEVNDTFNYLIDEIRRLQGQVVFLFAGPGKQMQDFMALSPTLRSLVPFTFEFDDFGAGELHKIMARQLKAKFQGKMSVEGGIDGLPMRILIRKISRGSGGGSFDNARLVRRTLLRILLRQAARLSQSRRSQDKEEEQGEDGEKSSDMLLTQTDLIGYPPLTALESSAAWRQLQGMIGLDSVKQSVQALITRLQLNYDRELAEKPPVDGSLNRVFIGNPGTGKTTVARYYAQILTDLGLLSNGGIIYKSSNDFVGEYVGWSENQTKAVLNSAQGKVLVIDDAEGFAREDSFMTSVVDTIVSQVDATATEDRAVLLLGHKDEMEHMFQRVNPGLGRRFPLSSAFVFHDYSDEELGNILDLKLRMQGFTVSEEARLVAMDVLRRSRNHYNFGNGSEVDILLDKAKAAQQIRFNRTKDGSVSFSTELTERDFDAEFDRNDRAESNIADAFSQFVGAEKLISQFQGYSRIVQNSKDLCLDPRDHIPFNFIFRGPPAQGTGKTTTARKMGQIFFDLGFLATSDVEVCSASELIGEYVGHTGPKTQKIFQKALGKVLFIDEAYRLGHGDFGKEAVGELVNTLTLPKYKNKLVTVIAGYDRDINRLLASNPGFESRFPEVLEFPSLSSKKCRELLARLLQDKKLDVSCMRLPWVFQKVEGLFQVLSSLPDWGNARDVENLATALFGRIISAPASPPTTEIRAEWVYEKMDEMILERRKRSEDAGEVPRSLEANQLDETPDGLAPEQPTKPETTSQQPSPPKMKARAVETEPADVDRVKTQDGLLEREREPGMTDETLIKVEESKAESKKRRDDLTTLKAEITRMEAAADRRDALARAAGMDSSPPDIMSRKISLMKEEAAKTESSLDREEFLG